MSVFAEAGKHLENATRTVCRFEEALVSRKAVSIDKDRVVVTEVWDTSHPQCPFVSPGGKLPPKILRSGIMSQETFAMIGPELK